MTRVLFHFADKTIKLWRVSERDKKVEGYNLREEDGNIKDPSSVMQLRVRILFISIFVVFYRPIMPHGFNFHYLDTCDKAYGINGGSLAP